MKTKLSDISHAARLAKTLIPKSDINSDGAIRAGDVTKIAAESKTNAMDAYVGLLDQLRRTAARDGGPTTANVKKAVDTAVKKLIARDKDGSKALEDPEKVKSMTALEARLVQFATSAKGKDASSFKLPEPYEVRLPRFSWRGTTQEVATSLLNAFSKPANDNFFPVRPAYGDPRASRFVVDGTEARTMVAELKKLYVSRQKAVLTELAERSHSSHYGCVSPTNTGKKVFEEYAAELGLDLDFQQPAAPRYHQSGGRLLRVSATEALFPGVMVLGDALLHDAEADHIEKYWVEIARAEKASVPAFLRMTQELRMAGAPGSLQQAARDAAVDEARHTRICLGEADSARGRIWTVDELDAEPRIIDIATLAEEAWLDGCLGEAQAADALEAAAEAAYSPDLRDALKSVAHDERKHAELAWAVLDWTLREGGSAVRDQLAESLESGAVNHASDDVEGSAEDAGLDQDRLVANGVTTSQVLSDAGERVKETARKRAAALLDWTTT